MKSWDKGSTPIIFECYLFGSKTPWLLRLLQIEIAKPGAAETVPGFYINHMTTMIDDTDTHAADAVEFKLTERQNKNFWRRILKSGDDDCWIWIGGKSKNKRTGFMYGRVRLGYRHYMAHRVSWSIVNGPVPGEDLPRRERPCILHKCDVTLCVNPAHLFIGTMADNINDMDSKGRRKVQSGDMHWSKRKPGITARGEKSGLSKLTEAQVVEIRRLRAETSMTYREIAELMPVTASVIETVANRKTWKHVA